VGTLESIVKRPKHCVPVGTRPLHVRLREQKRLTNKEEIVDRQTWRVHGSWQVPMTCGAKSEMFRKWPKILYTTTTMRPVYRSLQPICTPLLHPKHTTRIASTPLPSWTRTFHASAACRAVDLVYTLHDEQGKAKGAPIVILHGLFGSKKNNRSVSK
jgi:hypothetical protein